jgi:hypothetical protein
MDYAFYVHRKNIDARRTNSAVQEIERNARGRSVARLHSAARASHFPSEKR